MVNREFANNIAIQLQNILGLNYSISITDVTKTNDLQLTGITIHEPGINMAPTIYLEGYEGWELNDICDDILDIYEQNKLNEPVDVKWFNDFDNVSSKIIFRLVNTDRNTNLLKASPSIPFLDLSIIFYIYVADGMLVLIKNEHMNMWDTSVDELYSLAKANTPKLMPYQLKNLMEIIPVAFDDISDKMFVLSNTAYIGGAGAILYSHVFDSFDSNLFILPSSIHETILLRASCLEHASELKEIVCSINETVLSVEDFLSDNVYYYDKDTKAITIAE